MSGFSTLKLFYQSQLDRLSITYKFTNFSRELTFSFDPEKARLFKPLIKCLSFNKPLTSVWLTLQNCMCSIIVNRLLRWREPLINLLHYNKKMKSIIQLEYKSAIIPSCSSLIISSVI